MADLNDKLVAIENKLGGTEPMPVGTQDALGWHLDYIESLIDGGSSGGGTKLYRHLVTVSGIDIVSGEETTCQLVVITTSGEEMIDYIDANFISVKIWNSDWEECIGYIICINGNELGTFTGVIDAETGDYILVPVYEYCIHEVVVVSDIVTEL